METPRGLPPFPLSPTGPAQHIASGTLVGARHAIDHVDDAVVALAGLRRRLVGAVHRSKRVAGLPVRDGEREAGVLSRARRVAARVAVPGDTADALMHALMSDACRQQVQAGNAGPRPAVRISMSTPVASRSLSAARLLRLLPPPRRLRPLLRRLPRVAHEPLAERILARAVRRVDPVTLDLVRGRRLGIELEDLGLAWVFAWSGERLLACHEPAEATVRGSATDLFLLASRQEDADTLFFQRRLVLTGDVELGLTVRNLLDRLPWEDLPLGLRIVLHRGSHLLRAARDAHRA
ncbi:SCP2 sterol-binding domain-containing protein [Pseudoxanthomonas daejeonensis]|uniref:ubiquinone anaerobic biosynthesis accessory factor UbiT n=1 Tax=Pseudoxanthomonas daejeonensis TaxID=266062 RepID=UPI001F544F53|nr:SCP2 sterol-binding domain-containing protein [Pseudoxanthomonas daejeonensis]UNK58348.1 SCP2 sterol-binding domain-containing protein [Pseudoxanthomonas daejeonensis]